MKKFFASIVEFIRDHIVISIIGAAIIVGVFIWLFFFQFAVHLSFIDDNGTDSISDSGTIGTIGDLPTGVFPERPVGVVIPELVRPNIAIPDDLS